VDAFIDKIKEIILNHLDDSSFGVKQLASELGLSRSQTLRKVKASTGKSVSKLIKEIRLKEGAKLIQETDLTASEIAYRVGFSSPSYFNKCFHDYFGLTPGDYNSQTEEKEGEEEAFDLDSIDVLPVKKRAIYKAPAFVTITIITALIFILFQNFIEQKKEASNNEASIAVLAFTDLSPNKDLEWFSDGISEELQSLLLKIPDLKVISNTSSFSYKGKNKTIEKIGKELNVSHILEGSVRIFDDKLNIKAQLVNVKEGSVTWSESFERDMDEILQVQNEIAFYVVKELKATYLEEITIPTAKNSKSYTLYLKAKHLYEEHTNESITEAEEVIKQSIALDSTSATSWNLLSKIIFESSINLGLQSKIEGLELAKNAAEKSISLNDEYAPAYASLCKVNLFQWHFKEADKNIQKAISLDHRDPYILYAAGLHAKYSGRLEESISHFLQALKMDPFESRYYLNIGIVYYFLNQLDAAYINIEKFNYNNPDAAMYHAYLSKILLRQGKKEASLMEAQKESNEFWNLYTTNFSEFALGENENTDSLFIEFINKYGASSPANLASLYAFRGEIDNAFVWLDMAYQKPDSELIDILNYPEFKTLYDDPRWDAFITKMDLPTDHWLYRKKEFLSVKYMD